MNSELYERLESNAFDIARLQKKLAIMTAQVQDGYRQFSDACKALEYWSGMDAAEAMKAYDYIMEDDGG